MALQRTVRGTFEKGPDIQGHVSVVDVDGERLVEVADFILSKQAYGRGYHFPLDQLPTVIGLLTGTAVDAGQAQP